MGNVTQYCCIYRCGMSGVKTPVPKRDDSRMTNLTTKEWAAALDIQYHNSDHATWKALYEKRLQKLVFVGSEAYLSGLQVIRLDSEQIPNLDRLSERLRQVCGWSITPVSGFLPSKVFFECLSCKAFPCTTVIRKPSEFAYTPAPDVFHDVFGHIPMYWHCQFRDFVHQLGQIACNLRSEKELELLAKVYWYTVEFGLVNEPRGIRVYGSGLISSEAETEMALSPDCSRRSFDLREIAERDIAHDKLQRVLYVIDSFEQLASISSELKRHSNGSTWIM